MCARSICPQILYSVSMENQYTNMTKEEVVELLRRAEERAHQAEERTQQVETILEAAVRDAVQILRTRCAGDLDVLDVLALVANRMIGALHAVPQVGHQHDQQEGPTGRSHDHELAVWCTSSELDDSGVGCFGNHQSMVWGPACASPGPCSHSKCCVSMNLLRPPVQNLLMEYHFRLAMVDIAD